MKFNQYVVGFLVSLISIDCFISPSQSRVLRVKSAFTFKAGTQIDVEKALQSLSVIDVTGSSTIDLSETILAQPGPTMLILGTYGADFNSIEYCQRLKHYLPAIKEKGVLNFVFVLNASPSVCLEFKRLLEVPDEVQIVSDCTGAVGRAFNVSRGWIPDNSEINPYAKLFGMFFGLGGVMTLPSVIGGYLGNPWTPQPWIENALATNQAKGIWPDTALVLEEGTTKVKLNKFTELPIVGGWGRRPLELATLRLQNMLGISLKNWDKLKPTEEELSRGLLTQLGGLVILDKEIGWAVNGGPRVTCRYLWRDDGICDVANFEGLLMKL